MNAIGNSFLLSNKIPYVIDIDRKHLIFRCFKCMNEIKMEAYSGVWDCSYCNIKGNIFTLKDMLEEDPSSVRVSESLGKPKIYNPKEEHQKIKDDFKKLVSKFENDQLAKRLQNRVEMLIEHLLDKNNEQKAMN